MKISNKIPTKQLVKLKVMIETLASMVDYVNIPTDIKQCIYTIDASDGAKVIASFGLNHLSGHKYDLRYMLNDMKQDISTCVFRPDRASLTLQQLHMFKHQLGITLHTLDVEQDHMLTQEVDIQGIMATILLKADNAHMVMFDKDIIIDGHDVNIAITEDVNWSFDLDIKQFTKQVHVIREVNFFKDVLIGYVAGEGLVFQRTDGEITSTYLVKQDMVVGEMQGYQVVNPDDVIDAFIEFFNSMDNHYETIRASHTTGGGFHKHIDCDIIYSMTKALYGYVDGIITTLDEKYNMVYKPDLNMWEGTPTNANIRNLMLKL